MKAKQKLTLQQIEVFCIKTLDLNANIMHIYLIIWRQSIIIQRACINKIGNSRYLSEANSQNLKLIRDIEVTQMSSQSKHRTTIFSTNAH